ncbi:MAG: nucleotide pyrophosphohydrolase, partial [Anaerolineales bacterium]
MDPNTTVEELKALVAEFISARKWEKYHTAKNLAMSIAIESAELMEHFQWLAPDEVQQMLANSEARTEIGDELADVLIYAISFAIQADLDISEIVRRK